MKRICVYCGSSAGTRPAYTALAHALARELLARDMALVYGGASVGLMGIVADSMLAGGGEVIGVIPQSLVDKEVSHDGLSELRVVTSMHERKALMAELSDGFIALPGGLGTLEELFEMLTWAQLGFHAKPCALLSAEGYFQYLIAFLDHAREEGFVRPLHREMLISAEQPGTLLDAMLRYQAPPLAKWVQRDEL